MIRDLPLQQDAAVKVNFLSLAIGLAAAAATISGLWGMLGWQRPVPEPPPGKVHCVSYTPFCGGDSPFDPLYVADPQQIDADLRLVSGVSDCIRLYAPDQGLGAALPLAERFGLKVLLGIWIGRDEIGNEKQIALGVALAKAHRGAVKAVVVGNEVLLRGEQTAKTMAELAARVKRETGLPVTYADVTDFWLTAPRELAGAVDFITIHVLPYWEDEPAAAARGLDVVRSAVERVQARFPEKPIFIGETGFPSRGRERGTAVPSLVSQAFYLRGFAAYAEQSGLDYNLIEAFDQPWKRLLEGTAGGSWGLFDSARTPKFPWRGPVSNRPEWRIEAAASLGIAALLLLGWFAAGRAMSLRRAAFLGCAAGAGATLLILQIEHSWAASRSIEESIVELLVFAQSLAALALLPPELLKGRVAVSPAPVAACLDWLRSPRAKPFGRALGFGLLRLSVAVSALVVSLCLAFDPRYRDFPIAAFAVPAVAFAGIALVRGEAFARRQNYREESVLAFLFAVSAAIILVNETPLNLAADLWGAIELLLLLPWTGALRGLFVRPAPAPAA